MGMASWDAEAQTTHPIDYGLVQNTFVTMYWRSPVLGETVGWLRSHGYEVAEFDAGSWTSADGMLDDLAERFQFPGYFGRNLDALNDCMRDVASHEYGWPAGATGLVIILRAFDAFAAVDRRTAQILLNIVAAQARSAILFGNRIICLVQSNDPQLSFEPVGAMPVLWNDAGLLSLAMASEPEPPPIGNARYLPPGLGLLRTPPQPNLRRSSPRGRRGRSGANANV